MIRQFGQIILDPPSSFWEVSNWNARLRLRNLNLQFKPERVFHQLVFISSLVY